MKNMKLLAVPVLMLVGGLVLSGCKEKESPPMSPSPTESAMMDDSMSPSPMMSDDDMMMTPSPSASDDMMSDG